MSENAAHTPEPWELEDSPPYGEDGGDTGLFVFARHSAGGVITIAVCDATSRLTDGEMQANASLIAAAPDLLAVVRDMLHGGFYGYLEDAFADEGDRAVVRRLAEAARAAYAKATGGQP